MSALTGSSCSRTAGGRRVSKNRSSVNIKASHSGARTGVTRRTSQCTQCRQESSDVRLGQVDHHVHVQCRPRLTANRAGNRAADQVTQSAGFKGVCHLKGDLNRTERHTGGPRICEASGYTWRTSVGPSWSAASRMKHSRGEAPG
jgi:hypothetical protein